MLGRLRKHQAIPRLLADDLEVLAVGRAHATKLAEAQEAIGRHLQAMGSNIATGPGEVRGLRFIEGRTEEAPEGRNHPGA